MFGKKPPSEPSKSQLPNQSQSISKASVAGSTVGQAQAGGNLQQNQSRDSQTEQHGITATEVVTLLEQLESAIKGSALTSAQQDELLDYLRPAKREAAKEPPQRELVGQNLKQVNETMKTLKETTEAGKSLWQTGAEIFKTIAPWIGVATAFFGLG